MNLQPMRQKPTRDQEWIIVNYNESGDSCMLYHDGILETIGGPCSWKEFVIAEKGRVQGWRYLNDLTAKITQLSRMVNESETAENEFRKNVQRLEAELRRVKKMLIRVIGDHDAPSDCYSTGPLEGNRMDDICPSCEGLHYLNHPDTENL